MINNPVVGDNADGEADQIEKELSVVVDSNTVVHPWTVAGKWSSSAFDSRLTCR